MMKSMNLQSVAGRIFTLAQRKGYVLPQEIPHELEKAGYPKSLSKEVLDLLSGSLVFRDGRYFLISSAHSLIEREQLQQQDIHETVEDLIRQHKSTDGHDIRREERRMIFIQPLKLQTESGEEFTVLSQDLSSSGIGLICNRSLLGCKVSLFLPQTEEQKPPVKLLARILWTSIISEGLYKNGGIFLKLLSD